MHACVDCTQVACLPIGIADDHHNPPYDDAVATASTKAGLGAGRGLGLGVDGKENAANRRHADTHHRATGHTLAIHVDHLRVYCFACRDYHHDRVLDGVLSRATKRAVTAFRSISDPSRPAGSAGAATDGNKGEAERRARKRVMHTDWMPSTKESAVLRHAKRHKAGALPGMAMLLRCADT